jgi:hypothetical protein
LNRISSLTELLKSRAGENVHIVMRLGRGRFLLVLAFLLTACRSISPSHAHLPRYLVTVTPIEVGLGTLGLCIAVDPLDQHGVWWWEPGASGCATRSTGPSVFHADEATISTMKPGPTTVGFRLQTHSSTRPFIDVRLLMEGNSMRAVQSGAQVALQRRSDLDVHEMPSRGRE